MEMVVEDEIQKRNTDCVYFLASPLTCKKGVECEYRHSEGARLNPRDCYYWLAGNCLNPTCTFRHPPLDGRPENSTEPSDLQQQSSVPVNKTSVPCYFFFNGFCNKGDRCTFLHGPNGISPTPKIPKAVPKVNGVHYPENKASGNDAVPAVIEAPPNPSRTDSQLPKAIPTNGFHHLENKTSVSDTVPSVILAPSSGPNPSRTVSKAVLNISETKDDVELSIPNNVERSPSVEISEPDSEEAADKSDTPLPAEDFIDPRAVLSPEQSSEEQAEEDQIEREEWWESSPGLDVLVDNGSENYEDNPEYLPVHDREARRLHEHLLQYDYEDPVGYDPMEYQGAGMLYEDGIYDLYDGVEDDHISDYVRGNPNPSMEKPLDPMIFPKRKFLPREMEGNGRNGVDLRDHLKRRRVDTRQTSYEPRRRGPVYLNDRNQERPRRRDMGNHPRRRLASEVRNNLTGLDMDRESELNGMHKRNRLRHSEPKSNRPRPRERERRQQSRPHFLPSEISRGPASKEMRSTRESTLLMRSTRESTLLMRSTRESTLLMRSTRESTIFSGPKTLAQIKEEKRKARVNEDSFGNTRHQSRTTSKDFEEEKRKTRVNEDSFGNTRHQSRATPKDFEGPKPLSEILKEKRRMGSMSDDSSSTRSKRDHVDHERNHDDDYFDEDGNDFIDEYEDDEDGLEKKIASIFS